MRLLAKRRLAFFMIFMLAACSSNKYGADVFPPKKDELFEKYAQDNFKKIVDGDSYLRRLSFQKMWLGYFSVTGTPSDPEFDRYSDHAKSVFDSYCSAHEGKRIKTPERGASYACIDKTGARRLASVYIYSNAVNFESGEKFELNKHNYNTFLEYKDKGGPSGVIAFADGSKMNFIRLGTLLAPHQWVIKNQKDKKIIHVNDIKSIEEKKDEPGNYDVTLVDMRKFSVPAENIKQITEGSSAGSLAYPIDTSFPYKVEFVYLDPELNTPLNYSKSPARKSGIDGYKKVTGLFFDGNAKKSSYSLIDISESLEKKFIPRYYEGYLKEANAAKGAIVRNGLFNNLPDSIAQDKAIRLQRYLEEDCWSSYKAFAEGSRDISEWARCVQKSKEKSLIQQGVKISVEVTPLAAAWYYNSFKY